MPATGSRKSCSSHHRGARKTGARKATTGARKTGARKTTTGARKATGSQKFKLSQLKKTIKKIEKFANDHDKEIKKGVEIAKQLRRRKKKN